MVNLLNMTIITILLLNLMGKIRATGSPNIVQDKSNVENPQTSGGIPTYTYLIPIVSLFALITISVMTFKLKR